MYALFGWCEGRFEFQPQVFSGNRSIRKGRMEIILDAMRMLDDGLIRKVGGPQPIVPGPGRTGNRTGDGLPIIRGSMIDYDYILAEERFQAGRKIVSEGSYGNWIWVILGGKALISRESDGISTSLCHLGEGAFIGSFDVLLFGDHVRTATVTAAEEVHSALLDTHRLSLEFMGLSPGFRDHLLRMSARLKELTDDLIGVLQGNGEHRPDGPAAQGHGRKSPSALNLVPVHGRENLDLRGFQDEYELLSRTLKGFIQCTVNTLSAVSRKGSEIRGRTLHPKRGGAHRKLA